MLPRMIEDRADATPYRGCARHGFFKERRLELTRVAILRGAYEELVDEPAILLGALLVSALPPRDVLLE